MFKKVYLLLILSAITSTAALAQQSLDVNFNGLGFLDNREYKAFVPRSRTYSGTRTTLDFGLNLDSLNHFVVGVNALHEFGAIPFFGKVDPVAYYTFQNKTWLFNAGEFPREGLTTDFPRALLNDTLMYYRPNVQGLLVRYTSEHFTETGFIDWLSRQTDTQREQFIFAASGKYMPNPYGPFYVSHYFMLMHDAGAAILLPNDHINDNGGFEIKLGLDLTHKQTTFDSLSFEAGTLVSLQRERGVNGFKTPKGVVFNAYASYHRIAVFEEFYHGQGSTIDYGDSYYEKPTYNRIDIIYTPFLFKHIKGQFIASFHFSPGQFNDNQEVFRVSYDLGRKVLKRFNDDN
ncbi:MAG: hypothetical protein JWQ79_3632 [Mucilaginibacter sp.]|jgi:hypothetical protein|nr:hypothetical protein [Mucilaginibacter sp.]